MALEAKIWASRLEFRALRPGFEWGGGAGGDVQERGEISSYAKTKVIGPFEVAAQKQLHEFKISYPRM